jgi:hypothetical protein
VCLRWIIRPVRVCIRVALQILLNAHIIFVCLSTNLQPKGSASTSVHRASHASSVGEVSGVVHGGGIGSSRDSFARRSASTAARIREVRDGVGFGGRSRNGGVGGSRSVSRNGVTAGTPKNVVTVDDFDDDDDGNRWTQPSSASTSRRRGGANGVGRVRDLSREGMAQGSGHASSLRDATSIDSLAAVDTPRRSASGSALATHAGTDPNNAPLVTRVMSWEGVGLFDSVGLALSRRNAEGSTRQSAAGALAAGGGGGGAGGGGGSEGGGSGGGGGGGGGGGASSSGGSGGGGRSGELSQASPVQTPSTSTPRRNTGVSVGEAVPSPTALIRVSHDVVRAHMESSMVAVPTPTDSSTPSASRSFMV